MLLFAAKVLLALLAGISTWSFLEYIVHRFLGHSKKARTDFGKEHHNHHRNANYFAPTIKKALTATPVIAVFFAAAWLLFDLPIAAGYAVGFAGFYTFYELVHRRIHTHAPVNGYARFVRMHHLYHHFHSARSNHGVTSHIWDVVFGTYVKTEQVRIPAKKAMVWLCDEAGEVKAPFSADYVLSGKRPSQPHAEPEAAPLLAA